MPAYLLAGVRMRDPEVYQQYIAKAAPTFEGFDVKILALCNNPSVLEGEDAPGRFILLEFPDRDTALNWYRNDVYQKEAIPIRQASADTPFLVVIDHDAPV
ncbi:DUF1330 domain-containing protein [Streptomyces muensis]|uniref:DUF1330 domain-containing protein n=1 Tax=Streptomyces muensis TaxID=1077944 RepID=A0A9X1PU20_STRM4|nr:DUF1330 domain-containing protein [Streptomyces muensis]MCF1592520.1 DUF1330 domain-containing protein [Streptomyces muensis]